VAVLIAVLAGCAPGGSWSIGSVTAATPRLPFDLPSTSQLKDSPKKVFAHYLPSFPISIDNQPPDRDYYATEYLTPSGENGRHAAYGGWLRDRPQAQAPLTSAQWPLENMRTEVRRATEAGLDGFTVDVLAVSGDEWDRINLLFSAAPTVNPRFSLVLMPDAAAAQDTDADTFADAMVSLAKSPAAFRLADGRVVVSPFNPESVGVDYWRAFLRRMLSRGVDVAFVPCFLDYEDNAQAFAEISDGSANWGNRSPAANQGLATNIRDAHDRGKIWMQPVSLQDERPSQGVYDEANNTENLRLTWQAAIDHDADWVQVATWNDYAENTQLSPSAQHGWAPLDINAYYLSRFKTGTWPRIVADGVYVSYRRQPAAAVPTDGQQQLMALRPGSSPARDKLEVLTFLTSNATVTTSVGGAVRTYSAPAGVHAELVDLHPGSHRVTVTRGGSTPLSVSSSVDTTLTPPVQDLQYYFVSSTRPGT
jgi:hypothetical protein